MRVIRSKQGNSIKQIEKGQSMVELAISITLLLILLAGIVDLGRALIINFNLQDAAEEGIVYGTSFPTDCNQIVIRVADNIPNQFISEDVTVNVFIQDAYLNYISCYTINKSDVYAGKLMKVEIKYEYPITMPFLGAIIGSQKIPMTVTSTGVVLRPQPPGE